MEKIKGCVISGGIAIGELFYFCARKDDFSKEMISPLEAEGNIANLESAMDKVSAVYQLMIQKYKASGREQEMVLAQARELLLRDIIDQSDCISMIREQQFSARHAVLEAEHRFLSVFENMEDDFMRQRAADVRLVMERLLVELGGNKVSFPELDSPKIIIAKEIIPEEPLCFAQRQILSVMVETANESSHSSILAKLWNIPALTGVVINPEWHGHMGAVDGTEGIFYVDPTEEVLESLKRKQAELAALKKQQAELAENLSNPFKNSLR